MAFLKRYWLRFLFMEVDIELGVINLNIKERKNLTYLIALRVDTFPIIFQFRQQKSIILERKKMK